MRSSSLLAASLSCSKYVLQHFERSVLGFSSIFDQCCYFGMYELTLFCADLDVDVTSLGCLALQCLQQQY